VQQRGTHWRLILLSALVVFVIMLHTGQIALAGDQEAGAQLYQQRCASCHGKDGKGNTPIAQALNPKPRDHTEGAYMNALSTDHLTKVIKNGGSAVGRSPLMPPQADLNAEQIRQLVTFVRSLAVPAYKSN
jgi:mono/diheme cytochrome c family protein